MTRATAYPPEKAARLAAAAERARAEAEARRQSAARKPAPPPEQGGRAGPEPVRYGDWEVNGVATDF